MTPLTQPLLATTLPCWIIGHRGATAMCPENTLPAFLLARDAGAGMLELDIQQSKDGELFVFHDDSLRLVQQTNPQLLRGLLLDTKQAQHFGSPQAIIARAQEFACFSVHPYFRLLHCWPTLVETCRVAGLRVFPWTVDDSQDW